jgi:hypothetical protein
MYSSVKLTRKSLLIVLILGILLVFATSVALASSARVFTTTLTGAAEVPGPGDPDGSGSAKIRLNPDDGEVCFNLSVSGITLPATAAHIHVGTADVAGPVVIGLAGPDASGNAKGCVSADPALIKAIGQNPEGYYVNVHNVDFPAGALRGQLP